MQIPSKHGFSCCGGFRVVDDIDAALIAYGIEVEKQLDPLDASDFITLVEQFSRRIQGQSRPLEIDAVDAALGALDVDWGNLSNRQRDAAVKAANTAIRNLGEVVPPRLEATFTNTTRSFVRRQKRSIRRKFELNIAGTFTEADERVIQQAIRNQGNFVTNFFGERALAVENTARTVVANGLEEGLGTDAIAANLQRAVPAQVLGRTPSYYTVIANSFLNRSRTTTNLGGFAEAQIPQWQFEAVLDRQTTDQCRFLHEKTFPVGAARQRIAQTDAARDPIAAVKNEEPWMRVAQDENGERVLFTETLDGTRTVIARVAESAVGRADEVGRFVQVVADSRIMTMGIPMPPLHGRCRSTVVPTG